MTMLAGMTVTASDGQRQVDRRHQDEHGESDRPTIATAGHDQDDQLQEQEVGHRPGDHLPGGQRVEALGVGRLEALVEPDPQLELEVVA